MAVGARTKPNVKNMATMVANVRRDPSTESVRRLPPEPPMAATSGKRSCCETTHTKKTQPLSYLKDGRSVFEFLRTVPRHVGKGSDPTGLVPGCLLPSRIHTEEIRWVREVGGKEDFEFTGQAYGARPGRGGRGWGLRFPSTRRSRGWSSTKTNLSKLAIPNFHKVTTSACFYAKPVCTVAQNDPERDVSSPYVRHGPDR